MDPAQLWGPSETQRSLDEDGPIVLVNVESFWDPLVELLDHMRKEAFIRAGLEVAIDIAPTAKDVVPMVLKRAEQVAAGTS